MNKKKEEIQTTKKDIGSRGVSCVIYGNDSTMFKGRMPLKVFSILLLSLLNHDIVVRCLYKRKGIGSRATLTLKNAQNLGMLLKAWMHSAVSLSKISKENSDSD